MNMHLERALILIQQNRWDMAQKELEQALSQEPNNAGAHAMLSHCFLQSPTPTSQQLHRATEEAEEAIRCDPGFPSGHAALARVMLRRNRFPEARSAAAEAIRIQPDDADYYVLAAAVEHAQSKWQDSLNLSELALQLDPQNSDANNLRAMALVKLGRRDEAGATIDATLRRNPDDDSSHANKGWTLLEAGKPDEAMNHFKEALRLNPQSEWARQGIIEAIKARSVVYSLMLKYFFWMARFSSQTQFIIMIGAYILNRAVANFGRANPQYRLYCDIFLYSYFAFMIMTWVAVPLFNLVLRTHPLGKYALNKEEISTSNWIGTCIFTAAGFAIASLVTGNLAYRDIAASVAILVVPIVAAFSAPPGIYRALVSLGAFVFFAAVVALAYIRIEYISPDGRKAITTDPNWNAMIGWYGSLKAFMFYGILLTSIATSYLSAIPRRK